MSKALALVCFMPPYYIASMENRLLRSNGPEPLWFAGRVIKLDRQGALTPVKGLVYAALKPYVNGAAN